MADTAAHITAGPESDQRRVDPPAQEVRDTADVSVAAPAAPGAADRHSGGESDTELVGRSAVPADLPSWTFRKAVDHRPLAPPVTTDGDQVELPLPVQRGVAAPAALPHPMFGPVGRSRPAALVPLLAIATLGLYALIWHHHVNRELEEFDPKLHSRPVRSTVAVALPWLVGLLVTVGGAVLVVSARLSVHIPFDSHVTTTQAYYLLAALAAVPYLILMVPFSLVAVVMTLERLRCVEEHVGTTTDRQVRPVRTCLLLAIPVVGGLVLLATEQRRLNDVWDAVAPPRHIPN